MKISFILICLHIVDLKAKSTAFEDFMLTYQMKLEQTSAIKINRKMGSQSIWIPISTAYIYSQNVSALLRSHYLTHGIVVGTPHSHYQKTAPDGVSNRVASYKNHRSWTKLCSSSWRLTPVIKNKLDEQSRFKWNNKTLKPVQLYRSTTQSLDYENKKEKVIFFMMVCRNQALDWPRCSNDGSIKTSVTR